jgi:repressor LexA
MKKFNITKKQMDLFNFIKKYVDENNMAPSYEEMKIGTGVSSKCLIFVKIKQLQERGWITRLPGKNRSITIIKRDLNEDTSI